MKPKTLSERYRAQRRILAAVLRIPAVTRPPKPFQPLTRQESLAVLDESIQWLINETKAMLAMPNGPCKEWRRIELRARDRSLRRDFLRFVREQQ